MPPRKEESNSQKPRARRMYAGELEKLREEHGYSLSELATKSTLDRTHLNRLENGERLGERRNAEILDEVYGTGRHLQNLWTLARDEAYKDRYKQYMKLAQEARQMHIYAVSTIPALLQTKEYATEQLRTADLMDDEQLAEDVSLRLERQEALTREENPLYLRAILDEAALRRPLKDPEAWRRQLEHLVEMAKLPNVTIEVLPFTAGLHYLLGGSLTLLWMPKGNCIAWQEHSTNGDLIEEASEVESLRLSYDRVRDAALKPHESIAFIRRLIEESKTWEPPNDQT